MCRTCWSLLRPCDGTRFFSASFSERFHILWFSYTLLQFLILSNYFALLPKDSWLMMTLAQHNVCYCDFCDNPSFLVPFLDVDEFFVNICQRLQIQLILSHHSKRNLYLLRRLTGHQYFRFPKLSLWKSIGFTPAKNADLDLVYNLNFTLKNLYKKFQ